MMVVAARREEQGARVCPHRFVETDAAMIERRGAIEVTDMEMNVPHGCSCHDVSPRLVATGGDDVIDVQRFSRDVKLAVGVSAPFGAWAVRVDLDAQAVRISQVDRFADRMVRDPGNGTLPERVSKESTKSRPIRQQNCEMEQTESPAPGHRSRTGTLGELDQHTIVARRAELSAIGRSDERAEAKRALVVLERSTQIRNLQPHAADTRLFGQTEAVRLNAVGSTGGLDHLEMDVTSAAALRRVD
jgi:hypothetical protein